MAPPNEHASATDSDSDAEWQETARAWAADFKDGYTPGFCGGSLAALPRRAPQVLGEWLVRRARKARDGGAWVAAAWARARAAGFDGEDLAAAAAEALCLLCKGPLLILHSGVPGRPEVVALLRACGGGERTAAAALAALDALASSVANRYHGLRHNWPDAWEAALELVRAAPEPERGRLAAAMARCYAVLDGDEDKRVRAVENMMDEAPGYYASLALYGLARQGLIHSWPESPAYRAIVERAPAALPGTLEAAVEERWTLGALAGVAAKPLLASPGTRALEAGRALERLGGRPEPPAGVRALLEGMAEAR